MVSAATSAGKGQPITLEFYSLEGSKLIIIVNIQQCVNVFFCVCTVPTNSPSLTNYTILTPTSFTIKWDPPPIQHRRGFIQHYTIQTRHSQGMNTYNSSTNTFNLTGVMKH